MDVEHGSMPISFTSPRRPGALWNLRAESDSDTDSVTRGLSSSVQVCLCERARRRPSFSNRKCKSVQKEMAKMPYDPTTSARVPAWRLPRSVRLSGACGNVSGREGPNARKRSTFMHANSRRSNTCTVILCSLPGQFLPATLCRQGVGGVGGEQHTCAPARSRRGHRDAQA